MDWMKKETHKKTQSKRNRKSHVRTSNILGLDERGAPSRAGDQTLRATRQTDILLPV